MFIVYILLCQGDVAYMLLAWLVWTKSSIETMDAETNQWTYWHQDK